MLVKFTVGNFLSFKNKQTLDFMPDSLKEHKGNLHIPYLYNHEDRLLKSIAIYGHNSNGKSNLIKAFQFFQNFIFHSFLLGQTQNQIDIEPFKLNTAMKGKTSFFEITFLVKEVKYRYRLELTSEYIVQEKLYYAESKVRENFLFEREGQDIKISKVWNKESDNKIEQAIFFTKQNVLFLSILLSQGNIPRVDAITQWFKDNVIVPDNYMNELHNARKIYSDPNNRNLILKFIKNADLGFYTIFDKVENLSQVRPHIEKEIFNMWYEREIQNFDLYTNHIIFDENNEKVNNIEFELLKSESAGSVKYFIIVCFLAFAIKNSQVIWIDELDARFDSLLLEMLVKSFHDPNINSRSSQLIFTTHNTVLLDKKLRRDQMVVINKNERGESTLERMHSAKKPIRKGKSVEREYREGQLGGVSPKITRSLFDDDNE